MPLSNTAPLDPGLDLPHGVFDEPGLVENYQWLAMSSQGVGLICHLGTHVDDGRLWHALSAISLPTGEVYVSKAVGPAPDAASAGTALSHLRCEVPFGRWRHVADAGFQPTTFAELADGLLPDRPTVPVQIDVAFDMAGPVWDPAGSDSQPEWGSFHLEQGLTIEGTVTIAGTEMQLDGFGFRDHSRGHRDLRNVSHSFWCNGVFPSGRTFCTLRVVNRDGGTESRAATIDPDGTILPATIVSTPEIHDAAHNPIEIEIVVEDAHGIVHRIPGRVAGGSTWSIVGGSEFCIGTATSTPDAYLLPQSIIEWEWDGETGYGLADRCGLISHILGPVGAKEHTR